MWYEFSRFLAYVQITDRYCSPRYGSYSSVSGAKSVCISDPNCQGVNDNGCDNSGSFELCSQATNLYTSSFSTCLYMKGK